MSDLIRRADVLETYANLYWADERINAFRNDLDKVFEELRCLPSAQQWIPVGEELPRKRGFYLITTEKTHDVDICSWNGSRFESYPNGCLVVLRPQAWMPLPEPYQTEPGKGEKNDK